MKNVAEKKVLEAVAKLARPIIVNLPACPVFFHQPKRPESLRRDAHDSEEKRD